MSTDIFNQLYAVLEARKREKSQNSYVASLYEKGTPAINKKILEEAAEVCEASLLENKEALTHEICDLLFHTFVVASHKEINLDDITKELQRRFGTSGLDEKKSRDKK